MAGKVKNLEKSWDKKNQMELDTEEGNYTQLCVWPGCSLGDNTIEQFEQFMLEQFGTRIKFEQEVTTNPGLGGKGGRHDLFFFVHSDDIGKFAIPRLSAGIRWWEDVIENNSHTIYPKEILDKYKQTW